jgi:hypothetical protein
MTSSAERFNQLAALLTADGIAVLDTRSRGFGSGTLKVNGRIFALLSSREQFVVKLPRKRVEELVGAGAGERFDPGHGRIQKEWLVVYGEQWEPLAREALAYVAAPPSPSGRGSG